MDFLKIAEEYEESAANIKKIIDKYKEQLKNKKVNREALNGTIDKYEYLYAQLVGTAADMRKRGKKQ